MPTNTESVVQDIVSDLQNAAQRDAAKRLADRAEAEKVKKAASKPQPPSLKAGVEEVTRPNGEKYKVRKLGIHDDIALVQQARRRNMNMLLTGAPGTGKTALIEAAFYEEKVYTLQGTGDTITDDFVGGYWQDADGKYRWSDGPMVCAMCEGRPFYIDEIALIDPKVMALPYALMDGRDELRITQNPDRGVVKAEEGFYIIAACNPKAPGARMSEALLSRFAIQAEVTTDLEVAKKMGVNPILITTTSNLYTKQKENQVTWAPQMRELIKFNEIEKEFGTNFALSNLLACCPEQDLDKVQPLLSRQFAMNITPLVVSS